MHSLLLAGAAAVSLVAQPALSAQTRAPSTAAPQRTAAAPAQMSRARRDSLIWRRDDLISQFNLREDPIEGGGWYTHRHFAADRTLDMDVLAAPVSTAGRVYLRSKYHGRQWIFHDRVVVRIGARILRSDVIPITSPSSDRSNSGYSVWEYLHFTSISDGGILQAIAATTDDTVLVRLQGKDGQEDFTLSWEDRVALKQSVELARLIRLVGRTTQPSAEGPDFAGYATTEEYFAQNADCPVPDHASAHGWTRYRNSAELEMEGYRRAPQTRCPTRLSESVPANPPTASVSPAPSDSGSVVVRAMLRALADSTAVATGAAYSTRDRGSVNVSTERRPLTGRVAADSVRRIYFRIGCLEDSIPRSRNRIELESEARAEKKSWRRSDVVGC